MQLYAMRRAERAEPTFSRPERIVLTPAVSRDAGGQLGGRNGVWNAFAEAHQRRLATEATLRGWRAAACEWGPVNG